MTVRWRMVGSGGAAQAAAEVVLRALSGGEGPWIWPPDGLPAGQVHGEAQEPSRVVLIPAAGPTATPPSFCHSGDTMWAEADVSDWRQRWYDWLGLFAPAWAVTGSEISIFSPGEPSGAPWLLLARFFHRFKGIAPSARGEFLDLLEGGLGEIPFVPLRIACSDRIEIQWEKDPDVRDRFVDLEMELRGAQAASLPLATSTTLWPRLCSSYESFVRNRPFSDSHEFTTNTEELVRRHMPFSAAGWEQ